MIELDMFNLYLYDPSNIDHRSALINLANDSEVRKYMGDLLSVFNSDNGYYYVVYSRNLIVGIIYLQFINDLPYVSYAIIPNMRKCSIASELLREYSKFLFRKDYDSLYLLINENNEGSKKVAENVGFSRDGRSRYVKNKILTRK